MGHIRFARPDRPEKVAERWAAEGQGIARVFTDRLYASLLLIVGLGIAGATIGFISLHSWWTRLIGTLGDAAAIIWTVFLLWNSYNERHRRRQVLVKWKAARTS
jgi:hypothetical protein